MFMFTLQVFEFQHGISYRLWRKIFLLKLKFPMPLLSTKKILAIQHNVLFGGGGEGGISTICWWRLQNDSFKYRQKITSVTSCIADAKSLTYDQAPLLHPILLLRYHGDSCQCNGEEEYDAVEQTYNIIYT